MRDEETLIARSTLQKEDYFHCPATNLALRSYKIPEFWKNLIMNVLSRLSFLIFLAFLLANCSGPSQAAAPITSTSQIKPSGLGIAITPKNFPRHTMTDIDEAFRMTRELGDYAVFIYQWGNLNLETAKLMMGKSRQVGLIPILGLIGRGRDVDENRHFSGSGAKS